MTRQIRYECPECGKFVIDDEGKFYKCIHFNHAYSAHDEYYEDSSCRMIPVVGDDQITVK